MLFCFFVVVDLLLADGMGKRRMDLLLADGMIVVDGNGDDGSHEIFPNLLSALVFFFSFGF